MSMVERVARAICTKKGVSPDCLHQHNFEGDYPEDERREFADPFTGEPRVQLFHRGWRNYEGIARAAIEAMREPSEDMTEHESYLTGQWSHRNIEAWITAALKEHDNGGE